MVSSLAAYTRLCLLAKGAIPKAFENEWKRTVYIFPNVHEYHCARWLNVQLGLNVLTATS